MRHSNLSRGVSPFGALAGLAGVAVLSFAGWAFERTNSEERALDSTRESALLILHAAQSYKGGGGDGCPTLSKLREDQELAADARMDDGWGNRFRIQCTDDEIVVSSFGADGKAGTADDVRIPR